MLEKIIIIQPRGFCAGVRRAISIIEQALETAQDRVYCFREIVHNQDVVNDLHRKGTIFVNDLACIPPHNTVVFSAHGVSPQIRQHARRLKLNIIDATCPFVNKVHREVIRFANEGASIILVGIRGHDEVKGVVAQAPKNVYVIQNRQEAEQLQVEKPHNVALVMQTTLSTEDAAETLGVLKQRFPHLRTPSSSDICYATQQRQNAVRKLAHYTDKILVLGALNSSNTNRLAEVANDAGAEGKLVCTLDDLSNINVNDRWVLGITAGASTPETFVQNVVQSIQNKTGADVQEMQMEEAEQLDAEVPEER